MRALKARVENGRLILDELTDLPEGTLVELVPGDANEVFDTNDDLSDEQRAHLHQEIVASIRARRAGAPTFDADEVLNELAPRS
jgi:hypothetical protein